MKVIRSRLLRLSLAIVVAFAMLVAGLTAQSATAQSESLYGGSCNYWGGYCAAVAYVPSPGFGWTLTATWYTYKQGNSFYSVTSTYCGNANYCQVVKYIDGQTQVQGVIVNTTLYHTWAYVAPYT